MEGHRRDRTYLPAGRPEVVEAAVKTERIDAAMRLDPMGMVMERGRTMDNWLVVLTILNNISQLG